MGQGLTRRWVWRGEAVGTAGSLAERILAARGLHDPADVAAFLDPSLHDLPNPADADWTGLDAAAERLVEAIRGREPVVIYGDYDVDGMTATAVLMHVVRALDPGAAISSYVPHRLEEGYGLNAPALEQLHAHGARVVVSVDCGITAVAEAARARALGLDLIITDHHEPPADGAPRPDALLVHPRVDGPDGAGDLCGAGVAFQLAWRVAQVWAGSARVGSVARQAIAEALPLVALGTIADMVPLVGANRILTSFGLRAIKATPIEGLRALIEASRLMGEEIDDERVGFVLAPRLNACGRMGHARDAVRLLTEARGDEAAEIARTLTKQNDERRRTEQRITEEAAAMAEAAGMTGPDVRAIVLAHPDWHPGVIGIVCSRLVERFGRPTVLLQEGDDGTLKGSARSVEGYSIHAGLTACAELLERFGGHEAAAGLALRAERLDAFRAALVAHAGARLEPGDLIPRLRVDVDARLDELTATAVRDVRRLGPFGRGNGRPVVRLCDVQVVDARRMGGDLKHLAVQVRDPQAGARGGTLRAVWFGGGEHAAAMTPGRRVDLAVEPKLNRWQGRERVEGHVRDAVIAGAVH